MNGLRKDPGFFKQETKQGKNNTWLIIGVALVALTAFAGGFVASDRDLIVLDKITNQVNETLPEDLSYESVEEVYDELRHNFDGELDHAELLDGLKKGLADASGDNYTDYFNATDTEAFYSALNGSFEGIGAELGTNNDALIIVAPLSGFPAERAGLRSGDVIVKIDGEESFGMSVEEAVVKIRGEKGTTVVLTVNRNGEELEFPIERETIVVPSVESEMLEGNIGYIQITRFSDDTAGLARSAASELKKAGATRFILDLRNNSGGYVDAAVKVASIWQNDETVFVQKTGDKIVGEEVSSSSQLLGDFKTVILINQGSASASEIVAGALRDNGYATIIGEQSFGKGSVQSLVRLSDGSTLKVTIARWYTPNDVNIDKDGIAPDIEVGFTEEDFEAERDPQLDRAKLELAN